MRQTTVDKKKAKGTYRPGRMKTVDGVDFEPTTDLTPPDELITEASRREWLRVAPVLFKNKLLTDPDRNMLVAYCLELSKYFEYNQAIEILGTVMELKDKKGNVVNYMKNPNCELADKALKSAIAIAAHFGLTPASRGKLKVPEKPTDTPEQRAKNQLESLRQKAGKVMKIAS